MERARMSAGAAAQGDPQVNRRRPVQRARQALFGLGLWAGLWLLGLSCSKPEPLRIAVLMPLMSSGSMSMTGTGGMPDMGMGMMMPMADAGTSMSPSMSGTSSSEPNIDWAVENINAAGGVAGRALAVDYYDSSAMNHVELATQLASDERYLAVIGPAGSQALSEVADLFIEKQKPLVSFTSAAADLLRAYGGKGVVWRTRQSDIAQTELLIRYAKQKGAQKVGLLTSLAAPGSSFFSWFGFFAKEYGYSDQNVKITTMAEGQACDTPLQTALTSPPDILFVAIGSVDQQSCVAQAYAKLAAPRPRLVMADTGFDPYTLATGSPSFDGLEGFSASGDLAYEQAYIAHTGEDRLGAHGASAYDAALLLAYGLQASQGQGGAALIDALKSVVDGREAQAGAWDKDGIAATLTALRDGGRPQLVGATGLLQFEPELYMDLASSTLSHWKLSTGKLSFDERFSTADSGFLSSRRALVPASSGQRSAVQSSSYTPALAKGDLWAFIASFSSGWTNYRHQADALRQYQLLRAAGVDDSHIVLILADDIVQAAKNSQKGTVRNVPDGPNLYRNVVIDYPLTVSAADVQKILTGQVTAATPKVLSLTAASNLYVYISGHGGTSGVPIGAVTTSDGIDGTTTGTTLSPTLLRESLCTLQTESRLRRALVVIESCYSGAFGESTYDGIESGCGATGSRVPLLGTALLTASNSREVSYAGSYDTSLKAWVNDAFSNQLATKSASAPTTSLSDAFSDVYLRVSGSHVSLYNSANAGRLSSVTLDEFLRP
jgi:ABC-type branched-subunit amino acid transport system substrate-binding protein